MADYQKPVAKFLNNGMNWARSVDTIEADKWCYCKNIRSYVQGSSTSRPGLTTFVTLGSGSDYYTCISRLNNFNLQLFGIEWDFSYILGLTKQLYVGKDSSHLTNGALNPVFTPLTPSGVGGNAFSGNPLSLVDADPVGSTVPWKYLGDSAQLCKVGYYPGDKPNDNVSPTMARCVTVGLPPPITQTVPTAAGPGNLNGSFQWRFVFRRLQTGEQSNPSAATRVTVASPALSLTNQAASMTAPITPIDPQTNAPDANVVIDVYRFSNIVSRWKQVAISLASGAAFTDNLADSVILNAPEPSQAVNPLTGITHFNLFQPFVLPDVGHFGTLSLAQNGAGKWIVTWVSGDKFNPNWLPGSSIGFNNAPPFTIYQVIDNQHIELTEDASRVGAGGPYPYAVQTGTLMAGQPLKHIWGPYGTGQTGIYIFGVGHPYAPGTLFWCNGNDPDSTDTYNSLEVTDPSEPLMNGCMYNGISYVWSTERMFQIVPSLTVAGQFIVQEIPGGRGIWMEYSLTVQSTGIADFSITWRGKDGIYDYSAGAGLRSLTADTMFPFFPHDNQPGIPPTTLFPFISSVAEPVPAPDDLQFAFQRLTWFDGYLFYDFLGNVSAVNQSWTLVYDGRAGGWICLDRYSFNRQICRGIEIAANNLKIGIANVLYDYGGASDAGQDIACRMISRADDYGDGRNQKQLGDVMIDLAPTANAVSVAAKLLTAYHNTSTNLAAMTGVSARTQFIEDFASGGGLYSITAGLDITWTANATGTATLYQWELAYLIKPELTRARATDWDDDGYEGAKFFQGFILQANTFAAPATLTVQYDGGSVAQAFLNVNHATELELPYTFTAPFIAHQVRIISDTPIAMMSPFRIRWVWEPAPELAKNWITQPTSHGFRGYFHHRDTYLAIQSTDVVVLKIQPDGAASFNVSFASTGGLVLKPYSPLPAAKCKLSQYFVTSCTPFRLFVKDSELRVKEWGNSGPFQVMKPFGDLSFEKGARI